MILDVDDCDPSPCENGAICVDEHDDYTCQRTDQWLNKNCTGICITNINEMVSTGDTEISLHVRSP